MRHDRNPTLGWIILINMYTYSAKLNRIIDGDTLDIKIDLGLRVSVDIRTRLFGINCPEIFGVVHNTPEYLKGLQAKDYVTQWFASLGTDSFVVQTYKDKQEKYGRWLIKVTSLDGVKVLNEDLLTSGNAVVLLD